MRRSLEEYKEEYKEDRNLLLLYNKYKNRISNEIRKTFPSNILSEVEPHIKNITDELITYLIMENKDTNDKMSNIEELIKNSLGDKILKIFKKYVKDFNKEIKNIFNKEKKDRDAFKRKMKRNEIMRKMKRYKDKISKRFKTEKIKKNGFCINDKDYILLDEIEEIDNKDLIKLHYKNKVHCLHKESLKGILNTKAIPVYSLDDINDNILKVYKLPLSFTLYLGDTMRNYMLKKIKQNATNFKLIDTGIKMKKGSEIINITGVQESNKKYGGGKKIRKHRGINQKTGKLKKGFYYTGKKSKTGLREIKKVKK